VTIIILLATVFNVLEISSVTDNRIQNLNMAIHYNSNPLLQQTQTQYSVKTAFFCGPS